MRHAPLYSLFAFLFIVSLYLALNQTSPQDVWNRLFSPASYPYTETQQGILFASKEALPSQILPVLAQKDSFVLSPIGLEGSSSFNSQVAEALIQQQIVLTGHQKVTRTVYRVYDTPGGKWLNCQTDYGTAKENAVISVGECMTLLDSPNSITLRIEFPDASRAQPLVEVSTQGVILYPVNENDVPGVNFLLMRALYADAPQLIGLTNKVIADSGNAALGDSNQSAPN
jgi:hypothetical protein